MRKFLFLGFLALLFLVSCAGPQEAVKKDDNGNVLLNWNFLDKKVSGSNPNLNYYYTKSSTILDKGKLREDSVFVLSESEDDADYGVVYEMANSDFKVFQVGEDDDGNIVSIPWMASITPEPAFKFFEVNPNFDQDEPVANNEEAVAGIDLSKKVTQFIIRANPMDENYDQYNNVDDRYSKNSRFSVTWDKDALGTTDEVRQFNFDDSSSLSLPIKAGDNSVIIDTLKGKYFMLFSQGQPSFKVNDYKKGDLILEGLSSERKQGVFYLKIGEAPILKSLNKMLKNSKSDDGTKKKRRRLTLKDKYPDGYYEIPVDELMCEDHSWLYERCVLNRKISEGQEIVIIGKNYFNARASEDFVKKYKGKHKMPK